MKEYVGYFIIAQAILTGVIAYSIAHLAHSIKASAAFISSDGGQISWGSGMPTIVTILLIIVVGIGVFLIVKKK